MPSGDLHKYFLNNSGKPFCKWLHYFDAYERHFEAYRNTSPTVLELGVAEGGSLYMWKEYFGPGTQIVGVDCRQECKAHEGEGIEVYIGTQDDPNLFNEIFTKYPKFDIIIDDASHAMQPTINSFNMLYDKVTPNGIYLIEDTHTSYWGEYGGGVKQANSVMEFAKDKIDELNAVHTRGVLPINDFTRSTEYIAIYDSIVVFKKRPQGMRQAITTQALS